MLTCCLLSVLMSGCEGEKEVKAQEKKVVEEQAAVFEPKGTITIGLNLPLTGPYADQGKDELRAFELAIEELNQTRGILGMKVEYVVKDTKSQPDIAVQNATELIDTHGVAMITGGVSSAVAVAVSALCQQKQTIFMATVTHSDATTGKDAHHHTFRKCTSATMDARALASILAKYYASDTSYFYITADYTWGWSTEEAIVKAVEQAGAQTLGTRRTPLGSKDFRQPLESAEDAKPDVLVLILFGDDLVYAIKHLSTMELKTSLKLVVVPYIELNMALKAGSEATQGIIASAPWYWRLSEYFKQAKLFVDAFNAKYTRMPSNCAESAYMDILEYARAVERAQSFEASAVIQALEGHEFIGLKDPEQWRAWDHQSIQTVYVLKGKAPEKMENGHDFFEIIYNVEGSTVTRTREENPVVLEPLE